MDGKCVHVSFADIELTANDIYKEMGYGTNVPDDNVRLWVDMTMQKANQIVSPSFYYATFNGELDESSLNCSETKTRFLLGTTIARLLHNAEFFLVFTATAGIDYQNEHNRLSQAGDALQLYIWDALGTCVAEATGNLMEKYVEADFKDTLHTSRFSPGYCGWLVKDQRILFDMLPPKVCDITLNDSALMYPIKSISGIIGLGAHVDTKKYGCQFCELTSCYKKRMK